MIFLHSPSLRTIRLGMAQRLIALAAWATLAFICFVTLSPIGLRPGTGSVGFERFAAYALLGVFLTSAYPKHFGRAATLVVVAALGFEALQHLTPDRHGHFADAVQKAAGGLVGCSVGRLRKMLIGPTDTDRAGL